LAEVVAMLFQPNSADKKFSQLTNFIQNGLLELYHIDSPFSTFFD
jgi:hypothetical protein